MNESLHFFFRWFWISLAVSTAFAVVLVFVTWWPQAWQRYLASESAFWLRLGVSKRLTDAAQRFEQGRIFKLSLWLVVFLWTALAVFSGAMYLHFKNKPVLTQPPAGAALNPTQALDLPRTWQAGYLQAEGLLHTSPRQRLGFTVLSYPDAGKRPASSTGISIFKSKQSIMNNGQT